MGVEGQPPAILPTGAEPSRQARSLTLTGDRSAVALSARGDAAGCPLRLFALGLRLYPSPFQ